MEAEELTVGRVHHGHNIRRFRIEKNMNQEVLSQLVHLSQSAVSKYEQMRVIDDEMLHRFSRALGVPFEYLKSLEEDAQTVVFENNTVNNNDQASANIGGYVEENNRVWSGGWGPYWFAGGLYIGRRSLRRVPKPC